MVAVDLQVSQVTATPYLGLEFHTPTILVLILAASTLAWALTIQCQTQLCFDGQREEQVEENSG